MQRGSWSHRLTTTDSNGRPTTLLMYFSSKPPKPTFSSASTSNGLPSGFHSRQTVRSCRSPPGERTVEPVQKGMKDA